MISNIIIQMLGGYSSEQVDSITKGYQVRINELSDELETIQNKKETFTLCESIRGRRYKKIVLPNNMSEFTDWLIGELIPTLDKNGKVIGNEHFYNDPLK